MMRLNTGNPAGNGGDDEKLPLHIATNLHTLYYRKQALRELGQAGAVLPERTVPFDGVTRELRRRAKVRMITLLRQWEDEEKNRFARGG